MCVACAGTCAAEARRKLNSSRCGPLNRGAARRRRELEQAIASDDVVASRTATHVLGLLSVLPAPLRLRLLMSCLRLLRLGPLASIRIPSPRPLCPSGLTTLLFRPRLRFSLLVRRPRPLACVFVLLMTVVADRLRLGTLNVATLAGRVATVVALCVSLGLDLLALQETRVPVHSRASVEAAFAKAGWHCVLGPHAEAIDGKPQYGTAIISRVPVVQFALPETLVLKGRGCGVRVHRATGRPFLCTNLYLELQLWVCVVGSYFKSPQPGPYTLNPKSLTKP